MPKNPNKRKCEIGGCNAWAMRSSKLCAAHSGTARGGAPAGNTNRVKHGLYSHHYTDKKMAVLLSPPDDLTDEIALCRVLAGRLMGALQSPDVDNDGQPYHLRERPEALISNWSNPFSNHHDGTHTL